jgi:hypothetical protein
MPTVHVSTARGQKRKRSPEVLPTADSTLRPEPAWKRAGFRSAEEANNVSEGDFSHVIYPNPPLIIFPPTILNTTFSH